MCKLIQPRAWTQPSALTDDSSQDRSLFASLLPPGHSLSRDEVVSTINTHVFDRFAPVTELGESCIGGSRASGKWYCLRADVESGQLLLHSHFYSGIIHNPTMLHDVRGRYLCSINQLATGEARGQCYMGSVIEPHLLQRLFTKTAVVKYDPRAHFFYAEGKPDEPVHFADMIALYHQNRAVFCWN